MRTENHGALPVLLALLANGLQVTAVEGQTWHWASDLPSDRAHALDCLIEPDGRIHVAVGAQVLSGAGFYNSGQVFNLDPDGSEMGSAAITFPDGSVVPYGFLADGSGEAFRVFSDVTDTLLWTGPDGSTIGITQFTTDLELIDAHETATGFGRTGQLVLERPDNQALVGIINTQDLPNTTIRLMRIDLQGNVLDNDFITQCIFCAASSLIDKPGGGVLMGTYNTGLSNSYSGGDLVVLDSAGSIVTTYGTPSVDDTLETYHTILSDFVARPLANGRLVVAGATRPMNELYQSVVQLTDSTLNEVYAQFFPAHEHFIDRPGVVRCLDMNADNELFFGQTENLDAGGTTAEPGWPSAVRVYRFDTDLNITGTYLVDGFADSSYYLLRSVRATADGGALLTGSVSDARMNPTDTRTKAWVAKVTAEDLAMGVSDTREKQGWLFPNPASDGFRIELARPVNDGLLRILDIQGRVVQERRINGIGWNVDTGPLSAGDYIVHVVDSEGLRIFSTSLVKK